jgi:hypothetical protein
MVVLKSFEDDIFYRSGSHHCNLESITVSFGKVEVRDKLEIVVFNSETGA